jgi:glycosyltransferase involved in cell wall biosynthesis
MPSLPLASPPSSLMLPLPFPVFFDDRWIGAHGIGRFAAMLAERLPLLPLQLPGKPTHPLDPWRLSRAIPPTPRPAVFFSPGYTAPLFPKIPFVFCIHDLNYLECPENRDPLKVLYFQTLTKRACAQAASILTVSEFTRHRLLNWLSIDPSKIHTVGNGVDPAYRPEGEPFSHPAPYLLCVSNRRPHKNEERLLQAFAQVAPSIDLPLLFTGPPTRELLETCTALGIQNRVRFLGWIPESQFPALYRSAHALLFPSLYEGFGLPVLEAMASGTPVLTSTETSLPEISAGAALLVNPRDPEAIALGIQQIALDSELRQNLRQKGLRRAKNFTWDQTAQGVHAALLAAIPE